LPSSRSARGSRCWSSRRRAPCRRGSVCRGARSDDLERTDSETEDPTVRRYAEVLISPNSSFERAFGTDGPPTAGPATQGMGPIGETIRRTWQLAHVMKGPSGGDEGRKRSGPPVPGEVHGRARAGPWGRERRRVARARSRHRPREVPPWATPCAGPHGPLVGFIPCAYRIHGCTLPSRTYSKPAARTIQSSKWTGLFGVAGLVKGPIRWRPIQLVGGRKSAISTRYPRRSTRTFSRRAGGAACPIGD
jgi:hypothetical protein